MSILYKDIDISKMGNQSELLSKDISLEIINLQKIFIDAIYSIIDWNDWSERLSMEECFNLLVYGRIENEEISELVFWEYEERIVPFFKSVWLNIEKLSDVMFIWHSLKKLEELVSSPNQDINEINEINWHLEHHGIFVLSRDSNESLKKELRKDVEDYERAFSFYIALWLFKWWVQKNISILDSVMRSEFFREVNNWADLITVIRKNKPSLSHFLTDDFIKLINTVYLFNNWDSDNKLNYSDTLKYLYLNPDLFDLDVVKTFILNSLILSKSLDDTLKLLTFAIENNDEDFIDFLTTLNIPLESSSKWTISIAPKGKKLKIRWKNGASIYKWTKYLLRRYNNTIQCDPIESDINKPKELQNILNEAEKHIASIDAISNNSNSVLDGRRWRYIELLLSYFYHNSKHSLIDNFSWVIKSLFIRNGKFLRQDYIKYRNEIKESDRKFWDLGFINIMNSDNFKFYWNILSPFNIFDMRLSGNLSLPKDVIFSMLDGKKIDKARFAIFSIKFNWDYRLKEIHDFYFKESSEDVLEFDIEGYIARQEDEFLSDFYNSFDDRLSDWVFLSFIDWLKDVISSDDTVDALNKFLESFFDSRNLYRYLIFNKLDKEGALYSYIKLILKKQDFDFSEGNNLLSEINSLVEYEPESIRTRFEYNEPTFEIVHNLWTPLKELWEGLHSLISIFDNEEDIDFNLFKRQIIQIQYDIIWIKEISKWRGKVLSKFFGHRKWCLENNFEDNEVRLFRSAYGGDYSIDGLKNFSIEEFVEHILSKYKVPSDIVVDLIDLYPNLSRFRPKSSFEVDTKLAEFTPEPIFNDFEDIDTSRELLSFKDFEVSSVLSSMKDNLDLLCSISDKTDFWVNEIVDIISEIKGGIVELSSNEENLLVLWILANQDTDLELNILRWVNGGDYFFMWKKNFRIDDYIDILIENFDYKYEEILILLSIEVEKTKYFVKSNRKTDRRSLDIKSPTLKENEELESKGVLDYFILNLIRNKEYWTFSILDTINNYKIFVFDNYPRVICLSDYSWRAYVIDSGLISELDKDDNDMASICSLNDWKWWVSRLMRNWDLNKLFHSIIHDLVYWFDSIEWSNYWLANEYIWNAENAFNLFSDLWIEFKAEFKNIFTSYVNITKFLSSWNSYVALQLSWDPEADNVELEECFKKYIQENSYKYSNLYLTSKLLIWWGVGAQWLTSFNNEVLWLNPRVNILSHSSSLYDYVDLAIRNKKWERNELELEKKFIDILKNDNIDRKNITSLCYIAEVISKAEMKKVFDKLISWKSVTQVSWIKVPYWSQSLNYFLKTIWEYDFSKSITFEDFYSSLQKFRNREIEVFDFLSDYDNNFTLKDYESWDSLEIWKHITIRDLLFRLWVDQDKFIDSEYVLGVVNQVRDIYGLFFDYMGNVEDIEFAQSMNKKELLNTNKFSSLNYDCPFETSKLKSDLDNVSWPVDNRYLMNKLMWKTLELCYSDSSVYQRLILYRLDFFKELAVLYKY